MTCERLVCPRQGYVLACSTHAYVEVRALYTISSSTPVDRRATASEWRSAGENERELAICSYFSRLISVKGGDGRSQTWNSVTKSVDSWICLIVVEDD